MSASQPPAVAPRDTDVGILGAEQQHDVGADAPDRPVTTTREDVHEALTNATHKGSYAAGDVADGSTTTPALPTTIGLRIAASTTGMGGKLPSRNVSLPISDVDAKAIKLMKGAKVKDKAYRNVYQVEVSKLGVDHPRWIPSLEKLLATVAYKLGAHPSCLRAELDRLLLMGKGSSIARCLNADEGDDVLGTLFVQLPSKFTGGEVSVFDSDGYYEQVDDGEADAEAKKTFDFATPGDEFSCHYFCHYADAEYQFSKITSGTRVLLRYSLHYRGATKPTATALSASMADVTYNMEHLPAVDGMILLPLAREYNATSLVHRGINALQYSHRANVEAIKAAGEQEWKVLIINAQLKYSRTTWGRYGDVGVSDNKTTIINIFDEMGKDVTAEMRWLKKVVDFDTVSGSQDDGMVLSSMNFNEDGYYEEDWGNCRSEETTSTGRDRDEYGYRRYGYNDRDVSDTTEKLYRSSFLLAYCVSAEPELKALGGHACAVEIANMVVSGQDYSLLDRLLSVVTTKNKSELDVRSCDMLLQMLTKSTSQDALSNHRVSQANKIIAGLSSSLEPSAELYETIRSASQRFGHEKLSKGISQLLGDRTRTGDLTLYGFLRRADFALRLNSRVERGAIRYLEKIVQDMTSRGKSTISSSAEINKAVSAMISQHGWDMMGSVVRATLDFLHRRVQSKSLFDLLNRALLLQSIESTTHRYDFVGRKLVDFAASFVAGLQADHSYKAHDVMVGGKKGAFLLAVCYVMSHGDMEVLRQFGAWAKKSETRCSALLQVISGAAKPTKEQKEALVWRILTQCFVHHSVFKHYWSKYERENGTVPPSAHIRLVLKEYPALATKSDSDGRLALHHAAACASAPFEVVMDIFEAFPRAASVPDRSGLYPFMLASTAGNDAAFSLLLADPSLVLSGVEANADGIKKRKRSPSME